VNLIGGLHQVDLLSKVNLVGRFSLRECHSPWLIAFYALDNGTGASPVYTFCKINQFGIDYVVKSRKHA
jgi:hypothetical protein